MRVSIAQVLRFKTREIDVADCLVARIYPDAATRERQLQKLSAEVFGVLSQRKTKALVLINAGKTEHSRELFAFLVTTCELWRDFGVEVHSLHLHKSVHGDLEIIKASSGPIVNINVPLETF